MELIFWSIIAWLCFGALVSMRLTRDEIIKGANAQLEDVGIPAMTPALLRINRILITVLWPLATLLVLYYILRRALT